MKHHPKIYIYFALFMFSACNQKQENRQFDNKISLERLEDIKFPIDEQTFFAPSIHGYAQAIQKIFIWNEYNSSIYLFDLNTKDSSGKIPLELGPSTGLNNVDFIHFQSEDSIFLLDERSRKVFLHIPSQSYYLGQRIVGFESDDPAIGSGAKPSHFYIDQYLNAYIPITPLPERTSPEKTFPLVRYSFTSGSREFMFSYPDDYLEDQAKLYAKSSFTFAPQPNKILLSLAFTHEILILDTLGNLVDRVPSESSRMTPYQGGRDPFSRPTGDWEVTEAYWRDIVYDPFNQLFFHVGHVSHYYRVVDGDSEDGKTIYNDSSYQVFNVFDADLNKVAEIPADFSGEIFKMIPTPIGILALWPNPLDEDHLMFRVFKVNSLVN